MAAPKGKKVVCDGDSCQLVNDTEKLSIDDPVEAKVDEPEAGAKMIKFLGEKLLGKDGKEIETKSLLKNEAVGLYFSAHWCPPCRGFTPKLADIYNNMVKAGKKIEIVFLSSDKDEDSFNDYRKEMPWLALPYTDRKKKAKLSQKFGVQGIPSLIFVDPKNFKTLTKEGRNAVTKDPKGENFPWRDPTLKEIMKDDLKILTKDGSTTMGDLWKKNNYLVLYFSAHWCPPCRGFTPKFAEWYKNNQSKKEGTDKSFDTLFVSSDQDKSGFEDYYKGMPWKALPFEERKLKAQLSTAFGIQGIPSVVVVDKDWKVVTTKGRSGVDSDADAEKFPWIPEAYLDFNADPGDINAYPSIFFNLEGLSEDDQKKKIAILKKVAEERKAECEKDDEPFDMRFFYLTTSKNGPGSQLKRILKIGEKKWKAGVVDFQEEKYKLYEAEDQCTEAGLRALVKDFADDKIEMDALEG